MIDNQLKLFVLNSSRAFGEQVSLRLAVEPSLHEERTFEDGEHKARPLEAVRNTDVYVVQSLHGGPDESSNDKLCRLLFFIGALKDAGAARVTVIAPYLCYARKDRRTKPNDPVTTRYIAQLFEAVGTDAVVTLEVHNPAAFENAFRCRSMTLTAAPLFVDYAKLNAGHRRLVRSLAGSRRSQSVLNCSGGIRGFDRPSGRQRICRQASKRRCCDWRSVRRRRGGCNRAHHRRPDQHRQHASARSASRRGKLAPNGSLRW